VKAICETQPVTMPHPPRIGGRPSSIVTTDRNMHLDSEQESVLHGESGQALALALKTLIRYGEVFGARRLVPISRAHLVGSFGIVFFKGCFDVLERLADEGARFKVKTTVNPRPGREYSIINRLTFFKQRRLDATLERLGVTPNYSCACYEGGNRPAPGDRLAWAESSAVQYANSVIGARSNANSLGIDFFSAVTGWAPEFGYLLDENRRGQVFVRLQIDRMDACALGFVLGKKVVDRVPVIEPYDFTPGDLKLLGAGLACAGRVSMFHVVGLTPEAPDLRTVFQGPPAETIVITQEEIDALRSPHPNQADLVVFGCPHLTLDEAASLCERFVGKRVRRPAWVCMIPEHLERFRGTKLYDAASQAGVEMKSWCPLACLSARFGFRRVLAGSSKLFYYLRGSEYGTTDDCLRACGVNR